MKTLYKLQLAKLKKALDLNALNKRAPSQMLILWVVSLVSCCGLSLSAAPASAQAFCALRHPHRAQQLLFPGSDDLESFSEQVTIEHREAVLRELSFSIHKKELGLHTLYAVFKGNGEDRVHLGYIHVRSEEGEWGLIEVAWGLYPDLSVKKFVFQRCRETAKREAQGELFEKFLHRKDKAELRAYLDTSGENLKSPIPGLSEEAQDLGRRLIRSALKTISVTRHVWPESIAP